MFPLTLGESCGFIPIASTLRSSAPANPVHLPISVTSGTSAWNLRRNLLVDPEMLFNRRDADFELLALVDFALLEFR